MPHGFSHGIPLKKRYGQHFLRDASVTHKMIMQVALDPSTSVMEIGCGDGFLTRAIIARPCARLWVFEIDHQWATHVRTAISDKRLTIFEENILDLDFVARLSEHQPWTLLANLPYQITFPILHKLQENRQLFKEGVIMIQEEVAEKIMKTSGRGYGFPSLYFQRFFTWKKLDKVLPGAFYPPPKVQSRLLYFKPNLNLEPIQNETEFWKFVKICFKQPRRTLRNNLMQSHYKLDALSETILELRAQQMSMQDLLSVWGKIGG